MAKLYAELSSEKVGRTVSKGANEAIEIKLYKGNTLHTTIYFSEGERLGYHLDVHSPVDGYTIIK